MVRLHAHLLLQPRKNDIMTECLYAGAIGRDFAGYESKYCNCCRTPYCTKTGGCGGCEDTCEPGKKNGAVKFGYICFGLGDASFSPYYEKCKSIDPPSTETVPCTDHDDSKVTVTIENFKPGSKGCDFSGSYILRYKVANSTAISHTVFLKR